MKLNFAPEKVNPEQRAAIAAVAGPSLVIAGPGSGKTRTLTVKARYIRRVYPDARILCVTHTRKAADEMRTRIGKHENTPAIQVSTIHSLCYRILKTGLGQPIRILSDYDHGVIVRLAAQAAGFDSDHREIATVISQAKLGLSACPPAGARAGYAQTFYDACQAPVDFFMPLGASSAGPCSLGDSSRRKAYDHSASRK